MEATGSLRIEEFAELWASLRIMFPDLGDRIGALEQSVAMSQYYDALKDLPADDLRAAVREYNRTGRFFPKPADLRNAVADVQRAARVREPVSGDTNEYERISFMSIRWKEYNAFLGFEIPEAKQAALRDWDDHRMGRPITDLRKRSEREHAERKLTYYKPFKKDPEKENPFTGEVP